PNEFLVLGGLIPKIFRYIIDIQLRFQGFSGIISAKQGENCVKKEIEKLSLSQTIKKELQISRQFINKLFESNNFKVKDVISGIVELKKVTGLLGIKEYISNAILIELNNKFSTEE